MTKEKLKLYWKATRPFAFPASVVPVVLGAASAWLLTGTTIHWGLLLLTMLGIVLLHAGANMFNDYFDYRKGVDRPGTYGSSGLLTRGAIQPGEMLMLAMSCYAACAFIGGMLTAYAGPWVFILGCIGALGGYIYTGGPALKYRMLGDAAVFVLFGVLVTLGSYYVQTGQLSWIPALYAVPIGLLIDGILHGNNLRDMESDAQVDIKTLAGRLGVTGSQLFYYVLVAGAFLAIPVLVFGDHLPWPAFLVLLSAPLALRNIRTVHDFRNIPREKFAMIDAMGAQLQMAFGILMTVGIVLGKWL